MLSLSNITEMILFTFIISTFEFAKSNSEDSKNPVDTSSLICYRFAVQIPHGKFVEISSILKGESTWKLWYRFDVKISTWIRLSKSAKYRWVFHVDFSMSFRCGIDVTVLCFMCYFLSIIAEYFLLWEPILS